MRVESAVYSGYEISPYYDSMIAKIITHGKTRREAIAKMQRSLYELVIDGIDTNLEFQEDILGDAQYLSGELDTTFLEEFMNRHSWNGE